MRTKEGILYGSARIVLYAAVGTLAAVSYQLLTASRVGEGAYLYSASYTIPVWICGAAAAVAAVRGIRRVLPDRQSDSENSEEKTDFSEENDSVFVEEAEPQPEPEDSFDTEPPDADREPILQDAAAARAEAIAKAFAEQRAVAASEDSSQSEPLSEEDSIWNIYQTVPQKEEPVYPHALYEDIPTELPEGYTAPEAGDWEDSLPAEEDVGEEEEEDFDPRAGSLLRGILRVVCSVVFAVIVVILASCTFVRAGGEGVLVSRPWHKEFYTWDTVRSYTIDSTMISSNLTITLEFTDGKTARLEPQAFLETSAFQDAYKTPYALMLSIKENLERVGAGKIVQGRDYLINAYSDREDGSWYYVAKIIGESVE